MKLYLPSSLLFFSCTLTAQSVQISTSINQNNLWSLANGTTLMSSPVGIQISYGNAIIWSASLPFLSASAGNDSAFDSDGAFNITQVDINTCQDQSITGVEAVPWMYTITGSAIQISGKLLNCGGQDAPYTATFWVPDNMTDRVAFYVNITSPTKLTSPLKKLYFRFASHSEEQFYGLGAQASFASLKGQSIPIFSREQGVGRGNEPITSIANSGGNFIGGDYFTTYTAIPSYISTEGNVFYLSEKSTAYANFNFIQPDLVSIRYDSLSVDGMFLQANDMFDAVEKLTAYTGRMPALPTWVDNGAILGIQGGQEKVQNITEHALSIGCPVAAVWLQDWCGTHIQQNPPYSNISRLWWNWENDEQLYPDWNDFVQNLRTKYNIRTLSYINTFLANVSTKSDCPEKSHCYKRNLFAEATPLHYFVQNTTTNSTAIISSRPGLDAGIIDLTNPYLRSWFTDVLKNQVWNANISGFMCDFGEYTPVTSDTKLYDMVSDAFFFHNKYPFLWAQFQREVVEDLKLQDEAVIFHRSAAMNSNRYMNLFWAGDQNPNWGVNDGIKSVVTILGHMGLSGYSQSHSDIGGYTDVLSKYVNITRSAELLGRWGELAAISSSVFRSHEGNIPQNNSQFYTNSSTYTYYAHSANLFVSLASYRRKILSQESQLKGLPLLRMPVMYHPTDPIARNISYQSFYLGPNLYVAPVLDPLTFELDVYLPGNGLDNSYVHVWSGVRYNGGQTVKVGTPYGKPAVFVVVRGGDGDDGMGNSVPVELDSFFEFVRRENATVITVD